MSLNRDDQKSLEAILARAHELAAGKQHLGTLHAEVLAALSDGTISFADLPDDALEECVHEFGADSVVDVLAGPAAPLKSADPAVVPWWRRLAVAIVSFWNRPMIPAMVAALAVLASGGGTWLIYERWDSGGQAKAVLLTTDRRPAPPRVPHDASRGRTPSHLMAPKDSTKTEAKNGSFATMRANGHLSTLQDTSRGIEVHHTLSGNRRVIVERPDHTRIVSERGGEGYVQRPFMYHGHEYAQRSYYYHGRYYHAYYGRYYYHGVSINPYLPAYYHEPAFYGWVYNPWAAPVAYAWGWNASPWYGYYGAFFTPYPAYAAPSLWLTDYIIADALAVSYQSHANASVADPSGFAPLTSDVKQLIADEVRQQVALENSEVRTAGQNGDLDIASSSIQRALTDGKAHVFIAGRDLDVVDMAGTECALSGGDALQLIDQGLPDAQAANLAVLASKGGKECPKGTTVSIALADLQDMQNHLRETIDDGMQELQKKQGNGGLPPAPPAAKAAPVESAMASAAPPPPPESEVAALLKQEFQIAEQAEKTSTSINADTLPVPAGQPSQRVVAGRGTVATSHGPTSHSKTFAASGRTAAGNSKPQHPVTTTRPARRPAKPSVSKSTYPKSK